MSVFEVSKHNCYKCKEAIFLTPDRERVLRASNQNFHCLWGHPQHFAEGPSEADLLRRERDRLKQDAARLEGIALSERAARDQAERRVSAAKGQITKLKKRSAEGRCPCCNRVFVDLLSHMKSKHVEYESEPVDLDAPQEAVQ